MYPYKTAITTTLVASSIATILNIRAVQQIPEATVMCTTPRELAKKPGERRPAKLAAFIITS